MAGFLVRTGSPSHEVVAHSGPIVTGPPERAKDQRAANPR
ncbi:MAG: hypothetical protein QOD76_2121 [Solirubrobacteraceae bacterium]|jgi:hypothetical protein|nr:hypothetical protein [Solirubrobacteraceae bacterium]